MQEDRKKRDRGQRAGTGRCTIGEKQDNGEEEEGDTAIGNKERLNQRIGGRKK